MKFKKGQRIKVVYSGIGFYDTGKLGTIISKNNMCKDKYFVYVKDSKNNVYNCVDDNGNDVTWSLSPKDFVLLEPSGQMLFDFMYKEL